MSEESATVDQIDLVRRFHQASQRDADALCDLSDAWADDASWRLATARAYGDVVVALTHFSGRARASGLEIAGGVFEVFRFRDGRIRQIEDFATSSDAIAAAEGAG
jgi:ketosteroid isomerase-like protein